MKIKGQVFIYTGEISLGKKYSDRLVTSVDTRDEHELTVCFLALPPPAGTHSEAAPSEEVGQGTKLHHTKLDVYAHIQLFSSCLFSNKRSIK